MRVPAGCGGIYPVHVLLGMLVKVIGTEVFAFDPSQLEKARTITNAYLDQMLELARKSKNRTEIYMTAVNFFRLSKKGESTK